MSWSKIAVLALLLVVMFTVSAFGSYFGYTVSGVPKAGAISGGEIYEVVHIHDVGDYEMLPDGTYQLKEPGLLEGMSGFVGDMLTFKVDGMPDLFSYIFIIMIVLVLYILICLFKPGGD